MVNLILNRTINKFLIILLLATVWLACSAPKNYLSLEGPKFTQNYAKSPITASDTLKIITFNIKFAHQIQQAIEELMTVPELQGPDIILLQEMDEAGTDSIARSLKFNYIYYPATVHPQSDRNFGNAILSRWPIHSDKKILLPYEPPLAKTKRIAVSSYISHPKLELLVYSVHTATAIISAKKRLEQSDSLLHSISEEHDNIIIGGDFNTVFSKNVRDLEEIFSKNGFFRASRDAGTTVRWNFLNFTMDHLFVKGLDFIAAGTTETGASDHKPLWVWLKILEDVGF
jgi:endonuclease/exonuclease/phosphatase (EEP) superfamily protein YafD